MNGQWVKIRTRDHTGQKSYFTPLEASQVFPPELSFSDWKTSEALVTHHLLWMWFLNVWDNVPMNLKYACQQYFSVCFLGFISYNKTFIPCGFRKYENVFTHEYHIPLGRCSQGIWYSSIQTHIHLYKCLQLYDIYQENTPLLQHTHLGLQN